MEGNKTLKVACVQITTGPDREDNLALATAQIREAAAAGARLIVLPEATSQAFSAGRLDTQAQQLDGSFPTSLRVLAEDLGVVVVAGMFRPADTVDKPESNASGASSKKVNRIYNTALITGANQHLGYDKIHTYDAFDYKESDTVKPGTELVTFTVPASADITVGVATCYDIRFPEQFKELARRGAQVIVVPTSWADGPGKVEQWRILTAARALDSGCYIVAAGQARPGGNEEAGKSSGPTGAGHSCVVDPQGRRVAEAGYEPEILYCELDMGLVEKTRKTLPVVSGSVELGQA